MEAHEPLLVERFQHQKHNRWNDSHIGQRAGHVVGESSAGGCERTRVLDIAASTLWTGRAIRDLRSTSWTKSHEGLLRETRGTLSEPSLRRNEGRDGGIVPSQARVTTKLPRKKWETARQSRWRFQENLVKPPF